MPPKKKSTKKKATTNMPKRSANRNSINRMKNPRSWRTHIMVEQKTLEKALPVLVVKNGATANEREAADVILAEAEDSLKKSRKAQNRFGKKNNGAAAAAEIGTNAGMAITNAPTNSPTANAVEVAAEVAANVAANAAPPTAGGGRKKKRGPKKSKKGSKKGSKKSKKRFFGLF